MGGILYMFWDGWSNDSATVYVSAAAFRIDTKGSPARLDVAGTTARINVSGSPARIG